MKYRRITAHLKNIFNDSLNLSVDMVDENDGWTIEEWKDVILKNVSAYIVIEEWYISYLVFMDVVK